MRDQKWGTLRFHRIGNAVFGHRLYWLRKVLSTSRAVIRPGCPLVMNTPYNLGEEPIVSAPRDAVRTFVSSGLELLCNGGFLISK